MFTICTNRKFLLQRLSCSLHNFLAEGSSPIFVAKIGFKTNREAMISRQSNFSPSTLK